MVGFRTYTLTENDITEYCNTAKEVLVQGLVCEGHLTVEKGQEILQNYAIVAYKSGWFGRMFDKFRNSGGNNKLYFKLVRETRYADLGIKQDEEVEMEDKQDEEVEMEDKQDDVGE